MARFGGQVPVRGPACQSQLACARNIICGGITWSLSPWLSRLGGQSLRRRQPGARQQARKADGRGGPDLARRSPRCSASIVPG